MLLEDLKPGARVRGLAGAEPAEVVSASWFGDLAVDVVYRVGGRVDQRIVYRTDEARGVSLSSLVNTLLKKDIELVQVAS